MASVLYYKSKSEYQRIGSCRFANETSTQARTRQRMNTSMRGCNHLLGGLLYVCDDNSHTITIWATSAP